MDKKDFIKKYWFVGVVAILLLGFVIAYGVSSYQNREIKVETLTVDGKDVIYTMDGDVKYFADDLYNDMYSSLGAATGFTSYYKAVIQEAIPTTEALSNYATNWASYLLQNSDQEELLSTLKMAGYKSIDDLSTYCLDSLKYNQMMSDYYNTNFNELVKPVITKENPRFISHILVKVQDVEKTTDEEGNEVITLKPTQEETDKLNKVLEELKTKDFADVAKEYSEDTSKDNGGLLGLVCESNKTQYVKPFYEAAMSLAPGITSDVVETEYGYHILKAEELKEEDALTNETFYGIINDTYPNRDLKLINEKAKELGYEIKDTNISDYMNKYLEEAK